MDTSPDFPSAVKASACQGKPSRGSVIDLSVFDIFNIFRKRWFLERDNLICHILCAQKAKDNSIFWVEFTPQLHTHLVKCALALVLHCPIKVVKRVMFVFILEMLNEEVPTGFFKKAPSKHPRGRAKPHVSARVEGNSH